MFRVTEKNSLSSGNIELYPIEINFPYEVIHLIENELNHNFYFK